MQHNESRFRFPVVTVTVFVLAVLQTAYGWKLDLYGDSRGVERIIQSVTSVVTHNGAGHLAFNMAGLVLGVGSLELLRGSKLPVMLFGVAATDAFMFTGDYEVVCGASGLVMAGMAACVVFIPRAFAMGREGRSDARARISYVAAQLGAFVAPVGLIDDLLKLGDVDNVNHWAHIRGAVVGYVLALLLLLWRGAHKHNEAPVLDDRTAARPEMAR